MGWRKKRTTCTSHVSKFFRERTAILKYGRSANGADRPVLIPSSAVRGNFRPVLKLSANTGLYLRRGLPCMPRVKIRWVTVVLIFWKALFLPVPEIVLLQEPRRQCTRHEYIMMRWVEMKIRVPVSLFFVRWYPQDRFFGKDSKWRTMQLVNFNLLEKATGKPTF